MKLKDVKYWPLALLFAPSGCTDGCDHQALSGSQALERERIKADAKAAYLAGYIDGKDGRPPSPDAPNKDIGKPAGGQ